MIYGTFQFYTVYIYGSCMLYEIRETHRSLQGLYEISRLLSTNWCIAVSGVGLIHLVYNALRDLPVYIQFIYTAYCSCTPYKFRDPHSSIQRVYEITISFTLLFTT